MTVLLLCGSHPRHLFVAREVLRAYPDSQVLLIEREDLLPSAPTDLGARDLALFNRHFQMRSQVEERHFGSAFSACAEDFGGIRKITRSDFFARGVSDFLDSISPTRVVVFGAPLLPASLVRELPVETINLHLGLSPRYRGAATLFWPFYFLEPNFSGATFHLLNDEPDSGPILHQVATTLVPGDGIHDVAARTVQEASRELIDLLEIPSGRWRFVPQKSTGKNFLASDFHPAHLRVIYEVFNDNIVDEYLSGNLRDSNPKLVTQGM